MTGLFDVEAPNQSDAITLYNFVECLDKLIQLGFRGTTKHGRLYIFENYPHHGPRKLFYRSA